MTLSVESFSQGLVDLTPGEWKVLFWVADDLTTTEIAEKLTLTPKSVENYRTRIGRKLNIQGHHKLAQFARKYAGDLREWHDELLRALPPP
ncbi:helix-turn-helix domain-containing protein [Spirosoma fluviale]|uniref:Regulatory protein, luxR family n=1 Tax=Spirosoma fluviale TaxID=1597977 RepID=A0A286G8B9_9BACT|nr:helix-turn-helix transcriptional regulator [Spirosoma fluviale]SOD91738.1 regulatory protein, luxR family [Spirosoma fluviale]